jgi:hypothetical protein
MYDLLLGIYKMKKTLLLISLYGILILFSGLSFYLVHFLNGLLKKAGF